MPLGPKIPNDIGCLADRLRAANRRTAEF